MKARHAAQIRFGIQVARDIIPATMELTPLARKAYFQTLTNLLKKQETTYHMRKFVQTAYTRRVRSQKATVES